MMETTYEAILQQAYDAFNNREADRVLGLMTDDVQWPNGWEGGSLQGKTAVKEYWLRQWKEINPVVTPLSFTEVSDMVTDTEVRQVVKDYGGNLVSDTIVHHVYTFENGKIKKMEIV